MPRKKAAVAEAPAPEQPTAPAAGTDFSFGANAQPSPERVQGITQSVAEATRMPGDDTGQEQAAGNGQLAAKYPPRRGWQKNNEAGIRRFENRDTKPWRSEIEFREKPEPTLMDKLRPVLKDSGFHWDKTAGENGAWVKKIGYQTQAEDRLQAERAFAELVEVILEHKGPDRPR